MKLDIMPKVAGESASEYALRVLRSNVLYLNLEPGERISVAEISKTLNISRTPVQNAFARLSEEAMLEIYPQSGTYVSMIDMKRVYESLCLRNLMDQTVMYRLCETGVSPEALYRLEANLKEQNFYNGQGDYIRVLELDTRFHETLYHLCRVESIYSAMQTIAADQCRVRVLKLRSALRNKKTGEEHMLMLQAIKDRNLQQSRIIASEHVAGFSVDLESVYVSNARYFSNWEEYSPQKFTFRTEEFRNIMGIVPICTNINLQQG